MMEYCVDCGVWGDIFAVPGAVVDNYIKLASEASLKVLLYILRNNGSSMSTENIAAALNISTDAVEEAFVFWENTNILSKQTNSSSSALKEETSETVPTRTAETVSSKPRRSMRGTEYSLTPSEISQRVDGSKDIKFLFEMTENTFGRPLNHTEHRSLIWMHDYLKLQTDVILMLIAYCSSIEKSSIGYIETIACSWAEEGIYDLGDAQEEIKRLEQSRSFTGNVMKKFCMKRKPTSKQQQYIDEWQAKDYSMELIEYAYEKTIESIDKLSFPYINTILQKWAEQGITTKEMAEESDRRRKSEQYTEDGEVDSSYYESLANYFGD